MIKRLFIHALVLVFVKVSLFGQDLHLSQFNNSPLLMNPATAGSFAGSYRLATNYKNQWQSIGKAYNTATASFDMKVVRVNKHKNNYLASGITFYSDKAGKSGFGLMQVNLAIAYNIQIKDRNELSAAIVGGFAQSSISYSGLKWDSQYDLNSYDPTRPSGQNELGEAVRYFDLGSGLEHKYYNYDKKFKLATGVSVFHINQPVKSFLGNSNERLDRKYVVYSSGQMQIQKSTYYFIPQMMGSLQGPHREILLGGSLRNVFGLDMTENRVILNTFTLVSSFFQFGFLYRVGDALIIITSMELKKKFSFGLSYDINISKFREASVFRGGFEVSLSYKNF